MAQQITSASPAGSRAKLVAGMFDFSSRRLRINWKRAIEVLPVLCGTYGKEPIAKKSRRTNPDRIPSIYSNWYLHYVDITPEKRARLFDRTAKVAKQFHFRFRMWYEVWLEFMEYIRTEDPFPSFGGVSASGKRGHPLELYVLGALRVLGRHHTFDDLEESTEISAERHRVFFHEFIDFGSSTLFAEWIRKPSTAEEVADCMSEYTEAGFPGCLGSVDSTYFWHIMCRAGLRNQMESKESRAVVRVNFVVNHRRKILACTPIFKGVLNDFTIANFDSFLQELRAGTNPLYNIPFEMKTSQGDTVTENGLYLICDGGYNKWITLMTGDNIWSDPANVQWRSRLESMRKDVECLNGILKARWKILQAGIRVHSLSSVQKIIHTCAALHNMLLVKDGLDKSFIADRAPSVACPQEEIDLFEQLENEYKNEEMTAELERSKGEMEDSGFKMRRSRLIEHYSVVTKKVTG